MYISESEIAIELLVQLQDGGQHGWLTKKNEIDGLKGFGGDAEDLTKLQIASLANDIYRNLNQWTEIVKLDPMHTAYLNNIRIKKLITDLLPDIDQMIRDNSVTLNQRFNDWHFQIRAKLNRMESWIKENA